MAIVMIPTCFSGSSFTHISSYILLFYCFFSYIPVIHYRQHCKVHQLSSSTKTSTSYLLFSSWSYLLPSLFSSCPITHYSCSVSQKYRHYHLFFSLIPVDNTLFRFNVSFCFLPPPNPTPSSYYCSY